MAVAVTEIKGSRRERKDNKVRHGEMLYVSDGVSVDGTVVVGTTFFTSAGATADTGNTGRRCVNIAIDPEVFPGLYMVRASFAGPIAYA